MSRKPEKVQFITKETYAFSFAINEFRSERLLLLVAAFI